MNIDLITTLTVSGESEALEFKKATGTRHEAAMSVYAYLNQAGGQVLFGMTETV